MQKKRISSLSFKIICFVAFLMMMELLISCKPKSNKLSFEAMNTFMLIQSYGKNSEQANLEIEKEILNLEKLISTTNEESQIYQLNHLENPKLLLSPHSSQIIHYALNMAQKTDGALNPALYPITQTWGFTTGNYRVPEDKEIANLLPLTDYKKISFSTENQNEIALEQGMMLDLGSLGKGYAGDLAIEILKKYGIKSAILDLGGNIQTLGKKPDGKSWAIGIKNPWAKNVVAGLTVNDMAVITSGGYERYFTADDGKDYIHIFDGKTGRPVNNDLASVTIVTQKGIYGDSLSTALFVMGKDQAVNYWKKHHLEPDQNFDLLLITNDEELIYSPGLQGKLQILANFSEITVID